MINIGEISKPVVEPNFDKKSRANRRAERTGQTEAVPQVKPVGPRAEGDKLTLSDKLNQKKKKAKSSTQVVGHSDEESASQQANAEQSNSEAAKGTRHIDLSV